MALSDTDLTQNPQNQVTEFSLTGAQWLSRKNLCEVLRWHYRDEKWFITGNIALRHPFLADLPDEVDPSLSVFIGTVITQKELPQINDWDIEARGAPTVVFEISSPFDWQADIQDGSNQKPAIYGRIGVKEYWAYDPNEPAVWQNVGGRRLLGWRYNQAGEPVEIEADERGWYWSVELESWLSADEEQLQLHDVAGNPRLEEGKAEREARAIAEQVARQAEQVAEAERQARQAAEIKRQAAEAAAQKARQAAERQAQQIAELERELRRLKGESAE